MPQISDNVHKFTLDEHELTVIFLKSNAPSVGFKYMAVSHSIQILRQAERLIRNFQHMIIHSANRTFRDRSSI